MYHGKHTEQAHTLCIKRTWDRFFFSVFIPVSSPPLRFALPCCERRETSHMHACLPTFSTEKEEKYELWESFSSFAWTSYKAILFKKVVKKRWMEYKKMYEKKEEALAELMLMAVLVADGSCRIHLIFLYRFASSDDDADLVWNSTWIASTSHIPFSWQEKQPLSFVVQFSLNNMILSWDVFETDAYFFRVLLLYSSHSYFFVIDFLYYNERFFFFSKKNVSMLEEQMLAF